MSFNSENGFVRLGGKENLLPSLGKGNTAALDDVLFVPGLRRNLISIPKLDADGFSTLFHNGNVTVYSRNNSAVLLTGVKLNGLYYVTQTDDVNAVFSLITQSTGAAISQSIIETENTAPLSEPADFTAIAQALNITTFCDPKTCGENALCICDCVECLKMFKLSATEHIREESLMMEEVDIAVCNCNCTKCTTLVCNHLKAQPDECFTITKQLTPAEIIGDNPPREFHPRFDPALERIRHFHASMGHMGWNAMKRAVNEGNVNGTGIKSEDMEKYQQWRCPNCLKGRMKAFPESSSDIDKEYKIGELVSVDVKGPMPCRSAHGNTQFWPLLDRASNNLYVGFGRHKSDFLVVLEQFIDYSLRCGKDLKVMQADSESIFMDKRVFELAAKYKFLTRYSAPNIHAQNGHVERVIQTLLDKVRIVMLEMNVPNKYWDYCVSATAYVMNRSPCTSNPDNKTPFEMWSGRKPDVSHLRPFYSQGVSHVTKTERKHVLSPKGEEVRLLGYSECHKGTYIVLRVADHSITRRKNIVWDFGFLQPKLTEIYRYDPLYIERYLMNKPPLKIAKKLITGTEDIDNVLNVESIATVLEVPVAPKNCFEALSFSNPHREEWNTAILKELLELDERETFEVVDDVPRQNVMGSKMVFRTQINTDLSIKFKARLVAKGYTQKAGVDFKEIFAPTASTTTINIIETIGVARGYFMTNADIGNAYLEAKNEEDNYMLLPLDLTLHKRIQVKIMGSLYGLKQAGKQFNDLLNKILTDKGFKRLFNDVCAYIKIESITMVIILVYVDDLLIMSTTWRECHIVKTNLEHRVKKITFNDKLERFLGMDIGELDKNTNTCTVSQYPYINSILTEYNVSKKYPYPTIANLKLNSSSKGKREGKASKQEAIKEIDPKVRKSSTLPPGTGPRSQSGVDFQINATSNSPFFGIGDGEGLSSRTDALKSSTLPPVTGPRSQSGVDSHINETSNSPLIGIGTCSHADGEGHSSRTDALKSSTPPPLTGPRSQSGVDSHINDDMSNSPPIGIGTCSHADGEGHSSRTVVLKVQQTLTRHWPTISKWS